MRQFLVIGIGLWLCGLLAANVRADTFNLNDGQTLSGDIVSFNENGLIVRTGDNAYSDRVPWSKFSQADLKKLAENQKIAPLVEPFIEVTQAERVQKTQVEIKSFPRLEHPVGQSFMGAILSSSVGILLVLLLYAANLYAGYEIAVYRSQPVALVCGVAAIAPLIGPVIFLSMPTRVKRSEEQLVEAEEPAQAPTFAVPGPNAPATAAAAAPAPEPAAAGGLRLSATQPAHSTSSIPQTQVFQRGAFTFNRRFFETKFPGFFGVVRRDADKDMVLAIKSARGQYVAERITRIASNDFHVEVQKGAASEEIMIPFSEIQEIRLQHKDA